MGPSEFVKADNFATRGAYSSAQPPVHERPNQTRKDSELPTKRAVSRCMFTMPATPHKGNGAAHSRIAALGFPRG